MSGHRMIVKNNKVRIIICEFRGQQFRPDLYVLCIKYLKWMHNRQVYVTCFISKPMWWISMKFDTGSLHKNCFRNLTIVYIGPIWHPLYMKLNSHLINFLKSSLSYKNLVHDIKYIWSSSEKKKGWQIFVEVNKIYNFILKLFSIWWILKEIQLKIISSCMKCDI